MEIQQSNPLIYDDVSDEKMSIRRIATWVETNWYENLVLVTIDEVAKFSGLTPAGVELILEPINKILTARGINNLVPVLPVGKKAPLKTLDPEFVAACALILDQADKRSVAVKLKDIPMTTKRWQVLLSEKANKAFYQLRVNQIFGGGEDAAKLSLVKNIEAGDLQSIKHFHEVTGIYRPNQEILLNLGVLIGRLMEIMPKYLSGNDLIAISEEFNSILQIEETKTG